MRQYGFKTGQRFDSDPILKSARAFEKRTAEKEIKEQQVSAEESIVREAQCTNVIPGTFIVCGEGGNYCSEECYELHR